MKSIRLLPFVTLTVLLATGCDKPTPATESATQLAEMQRKADEAIARQRELEQQLEDQKLAAERDAIERERMQLDEARAALELQQSQTAEADAEKIRLREEALAAREATLEAQRAASEEKEARLRERDIQLSASELELAGSEAIIRDEPVWDETPVGDYGTFYDSLSSYGSWFETPNYGYVWQPGVVRDSAWRPYTRGRWACSDHGWTWVSDEPFGWATYHYGRWALVRGIGWVWAPGSEWAPCWVSWRTSGSHIGWAPLPPETLAYRRHHWGSSVDVTFGIGALWFNFVETHNFDRPIYRHCLPYRENHTFFQQTNNITNIHVRNNHIISGGPRYADLSRRIGRSLPFYHLDIDHHSRPGRDSLAMQPRIDGSRLRMAAPSMDVPWNDNLKPKHLKKRLDSIDVERAETLSPEITEQFRRNREENQRKAEQSIENLGGRETFDRRRIEQLEANRLKVDQQKRKIQEIKESRDTREVREVRKERETRDNREVPATRDTRETRPQDPPTERVDRRRPTDDRSTRSPRDPQIHKRPDPTPNPEVVPVSPSEQVQSEPVTPQPIPSSPKETPRQVDPPDLRPKTEDVQRQRDQARKTLLEITRREQADQLEENTRRQREQTREAQQQEVQREQARKTLIDKARRVQAEQLEQNAQRQQEQAREAQQQEVQLEEARKAQIENTRRDQADQLDQNAKRQQEQAAREAQQDAQREQARQMQLENARREQAEQLERNAKRQQEQAAREAQQEAQREQARQMQLENARREQAEQQEQNAQRQRDQAAREAQQAAQREQAAREAQQAAQREQAAREAQQAAQREQAAREAQQAAQREQAAREAQQEAQREQARQKLREEHERESARDRR